MSIPFEQQYEDVLQNIEFAIVSTYRERPQEISDWSVEAALDALIRAYGAEHTGRTPPSARLSEVEQLIYDRVRRMCEWRLGHEQLLAEQAPPAMREIEAKSLDEIVACLKRVRTSVKRWHKAGGRRGYLDFVSKYVR
ncbi:MAG TPA: hypothetical protein VKE41_24185 [Roseiflexaceae bacterium]|nr:hypothetical protein [Roseiflexaceae bacterium]